MATERTKINYKPLWKMLIDRDITKQQLREKTSIARSTMMKMANNEYVAMDVLIRICIAMECGMDDIVEIERNNGGN
ncbi:MAG: helix-turn-helix transcriptional regulator [Lachnospiraceae bacterium]|nr:helix-turn-helix transcriptional regulator [Lachnospiraceae bacterium]